MRSLTYGLRLGGRPGSSAWDSQPEARCAPLSRGSAWRNRDWRNREKKKGLARGHPLALPGMGCAPAPMCPRDCGPTQGFCLTREYVGPVATGPYVRLISILVI